ncbi:hypothetical protein ACFE04_021259 [Oxalis oulophora]
MEPTNHQGNNNNNNSKGGSLNNGANNNNSNKTSRPRWTPTPDQLRILKDFYYNNGIRSPTDDLVRRISARLCQYGKVEDKIVFYWFQNYKARERQNKRLGAYSNHPITSTIFIMQPQQQKAANVSTNNIQNGQNIINYNCPTSQEFSSASQSSNGMVTIGHNYGGGGGGHASLNMDKSVKDCTISTKYGGEAVNHNNKVHDNLGWVGFDLYCSSNIFDHKNNNYSINVEEIDDDQDDHDQNVNIGHQELETVPLFPMHGGFYGNSSSEHHHYYGGGSSRVSLELSIKPYFFGS